MLLEEILSGKQNNHLNQCDFWNETGARCTTTQTALKSSWDRVSASQVKRVRVHRGFLLKSNTFSSSHHLCTRMTSGLVELFTPQNV